MANYALRKYGVQTTIDFELYEVDGVDLRTDWVPATADCEIMKDGGTSTTCTNDATDEGSTYSIVLTATEMEAARLVLKIVDAATKVFLDAVVIIETYGHASAQHAFDLDAENLTSAQRTAQVALLDGAVTGFTAVTGTLSTTAMTTDLTEATDDHYIGRTVIWTSGVLDGQASDITDYAGSNKLVTYTAVTEAPSNLDTFIIV